MKIVSTIKNYEVSFCESLPLDEDYFIIDKKVYDLHRERLSSIDINKIYLVDADEKEKSFSRCANHIEKLISLGLRRGNIIAAIGGGIIQDLTGFVASIIYRGVDWNFYPTTLLSQCDSCIGGKTSINLSGSKNTVGNFNPPNKVILNERFLDTLAKQEIQSGLGEILKVMVIDKKCRIESEEFLACVQNSKIKTSVLKSALEIKKEIIEKDEFDKGIRNVMNYGHTFGHAIESLTSFFLALLLFKLLKKKIKVGTTGFLGILLYGVSRFFLEFLRGDSRGTFFNSSLSTSQGISLILIAISTFILLRRNNSY